MAFPSLSLSLPVWLSLRLSRAEPAFVFSAAEADALPMDGLLSLMLLTLMVIVALSVFVPSDA